MYIWIVKQIILSLACIAIVHCLIRYYTDTFSKPYVVHMVDHTSDDYLDILHTIKKEDLVSVEAGTNKFPREILESSTNGHSDTYTLNVGERNHVSHTSDQDHHNILQSSKTQMVQDDQKENNETLSNLPQKQEYVGNEELLTSNIKDSMKDGMQQELQDYLNSISQSGEKNIQENDNSSETESNK